MATNKITFDGKPARKAGDFDVSKLAGKSVLLTGGASGIGEAIVRALVTAGAYVTFGDVNAEKGEALVKDLGGESKARFVKCDVMSWKDQVNLFNVAKDQSPAKTIDVVMPNAGVITLETFEEDAKGFDPPEPDFTTVHTTLNGMLYTAKLGIWFLQQMPQGPGRDRAIILTASISAFVDHATLPQYSLSKWAIRGFMRATRRTLPAKGIRINIIAPWYTRTGILPSAIWDTLEGAGTPLAQATDVAAAAVHLAADEDVNGRAFAVLPRKLNADGYVDMGEDDYVEGSYLADLQRVVLGA